MFNSKFLNGEVPSVESFKINNNNDILKPTLFEPGVNYFLDNTLKNIHVNKKKRFDTFLNIILLFIFIVILGVILVYKYNNKPTKSNYTRRRA